jgi:hypothetical protein
MSATDTPEKDVSQSNPRQPGGKKWFWKMRLKYGTALFAPVLYWLLYVAVFKDEFALAYPGGGADPRIVFIEKESWVDWLLMSLPSGMMLVSTVYTSYCLWRIQVNLKGGGRPFTPHDGHWARRVEANWLVTGAVCVAVFVASIPRYSDRYDARVLVPELMASMLMAAMGYAAMLVLGQVHRLAMAHYQQLEEVA